MRILLFDWTHGGHHPIYMRRFAEALAPLADVSVSAPQTTIEEVSDLDVGTIPLGEARPSIAAPHGLRRGTSDIARRELGLLVEAARRAAADHVLHLYADAALPHLATRRSHGTRLTTLLFYPRAHYPDAFGVRLPPAERLRAVAKEAALAVWRRRRDAHAVMTLDEEAARRWNARSGAPAYWVPEPTIESTPAREQAAERSGCVLYGALAERKGIDLLAQAVACSSAPLRLVIAGEPDADFVPRLRELAAEMERSGATVELRSRRHTETEGLRALAAARCAVLPYPRHDGMSRVLVEACSVGTPVIVHNYGLLAHLVRSHGLGLVVDCRDCRALRRALESLATDAEAAARYAPALRRFAALFSRERFAEAVSRPFVAESRRDGPRPRVASKPRAGA